MHTICIQLTPVLTKDEVGRESTGQVLNSCDCQVMVQARVQTLADVLKGNSDAPGVICAGGGPAYSRGQLETRIKYVANLLRNSGIKQGDAVSIAKANTVSGFASLTSWSMTLSPRKTGS